MLTAHRGGHAGKPTIVIPSIAEQFFWGSLVARIGMGPYPISRTQLTSRKLADRLEAVIYNAERKQRAADIGQRLRRENGVEQAVGAINALEALKIR